MTRRSLFTEHSSRLRKERSMLTKHKPYFEAFHACRQQLQAEGWNPSRGYAGVCEDHANVSLNITITSIRDIAKILRTIVKYDFHQRKGEEPGINEVTGTRSFDLYVGKKPTLFSKVWDDEWEEYNFIDLTIYFKNAKGDACRTIGTGTYEAPREKMKFLCGQALTDWERDNPNA